jgi:hypothetical protein
MSGQGPNQGWGEEGDGKLGGWQWREGGSRAEVSVCIVWKRSGVQMLAKGGSKAVTNETR